MSTSNSHLNSDVSAAGVDRTVDKNVIFTVYRPVTIIPNKWFPLLAFPHLSKRRPNAPNDEPNPTEEVQERAAQILSREQILYEPSKLDRGFSVPQKSFLTFVPSIEGCEFNPQGVRISWQKTVHKVEFEIKALIDVDGREVEGHMAVRLGSKLLCKVPLRIDVDSRLIRPEVHPEIQPESGPQHKKLELSEALQEAFDPVTFDRMLHQRLDKRRYNIVRDQEFPEIIYQVIEAADRDNWLPKLIAGAIAASPDNPQLQAFIQKYPEYNPSNPPIQRENIAGALRYLSERLSG